MAALLDIKNLSVCIKKDRKLLNILSNISFSIEEGGITGLAGESGCGKSMTALSILNLLPQAVKIINGEINYKTKDLTLLDEEKMREIRGKEISCIFQDSRQALNPLMKIGKQIAETLELNRKLYKKEQRNNNESIISELLTSLGFNNLEKILNAYPHQLSGGMCQRIVAAIALIKQPKFLLADEPSSSLDEESQKQCLSLLLKLNKENKMSLLIISHDLSIIHNICNRYIIMYAGRIMEEGNSQNLLTPIHPYTRALVNALPHKDKRGQNLENIPGKVPSVEDQLTGCPFAPRCSKAQSICSKSFPPVKTTDNSKVYCHFS